MFLSSMTSRLNDQRRSSDAAVSVSLVAVSRLQQAVARQMLQSSLCCLSWGRGYDLSVKNIL